MMNRNGLKSLYRLISVYVVAAGLGMLFIAAPALAAESLLPENVHPGLNDLLKVTGAPQTTTIDAVVLKPILDFVLLEKSPDDQYYGSPDTLLNPIVYHQFDMRQPLSKVLEYAFHPHIPSYVLALSSIRQSYWKEVNGRAQPFPENIADRLADLQEPVVIHGIEHEEIAPDLNTGTYYSYDLIRTLIMCRVDGRKVLLSLSRQRDLSDVGRKGFVLGSDDNWNYIYSGEKGINKIGLGWVDSYMYDAFSAIVYVQPDDHTPLVRVGIFKWLRAGWNDMNFVRRSHIRRGLERYADTYREIMEAPDLPASASIAAKAEEIGQMSLAQLQGHGRQHLQALKARYGGDRQFPGKWFDQAVENGTYLEQLTRSQLEAIVFLDYMKAALGRQPDQLMGAHLPAEQAP